MFSIKNNFCFWWRIFCACRRAFKFIDIERLQLKSIVQNLFLGMKNQMYFFYTLKGWMMIITKRQWKIFECKGISTELGFWLYSKVRQSSVTIILFLRQKINRNLNERFKFQTKLGNVSVWMAKIRFCQEKNRGN